MNLYNPALVPSRKLKVFISSICGKPKYDKIRHDLKMTIENTGLAQVYTFEGEQGSTLSAEEHYTFGLEDSDVCIFLIDNEDGVYPGVQKEIDTAKKNDIKSLYYFCDENTTEKTLLEKSLLGAKFAKSKTVHHFDELSKNSAQGLIDDIVLIYHYYCKKYFHNTEEHDAQEDKIHISDIEKTPIPIIPKTVLNEIDQCSDYFLKLSTGYSKHCNPKRENKICDMDEWCAQFLSVLFEGKSIKEYNTGMFLDVLKKYQTAEYYKIVEIRWKAIQAYFLNNIDECIKYLDSALQLAKENKQPTWVINDILIDQRNQHWLQCEIKGQYTIPQAQNEMDSSKDMVYYPIVDRLKENLYEEYIDSLYRKKVESPFAVTWGSNINKYVELLASSYITIMYNGSLTHIILMYDVIKQFLFYLSSRYSNWNFRKNLYKFAISIGTEKEIKGIEDSYPEILNKLSSEEAQEIIAFSSVNPISHKYLQAQLRAFGAVGYYLDNESFEKYHKIIVKGIKDWFTSSSHNLNIGGSIFPSLSRIAYRIPQNELANICCLFMKNHFIRWYADMFKFIDYHINLKKMDRSEAKLLIDHVINIMSITKEREQINLYPSFLSTLRNQDKDLTRELDKKIAQYFPEYYKTNYALGLNCFERKNKWEFIHKYINEIRKNNEEQGKNGRFFGESIRYIATIRSLIIGDKTDDEDNDLIDDLISVTSNTLYSKETIKIKIDALSLLICIIIKYPSAYKRNYNKYERLLKNQDIIIESSFKEIFSNIDQLALNIGLQFLYVAMGQNRYTEILELMTCLEGDIATTISVAIQIKEYLEISEVVVLPDKIEMIVLQNVLQWLNSENIIIRQNAVWILLSLCRSPANVNVVNRQIIRLIESDNVYIKNLIMKNMWVRGIQKETRDYVISKSENDPHYVVRMVCKEVKEKHDKH